MLKIKDKSKLKLLRTEIKEIIQKFFVNSASHPSKKNLSWDLKQLNKRIILLQRCFIDIKKKHETDLNLYLKRFETDNQFSKLEDIIEHYKYISKHTVRGLRSIREKPFNLANHEIAHELNKLYKKYNGKEIKLTKRNDGKDRYSGEAYEFLKIVCSLHKSLALSEIANLFQQRSSIKVPPKSVSVTFKPSKIAR